MTMHAPQHVQVSLPQLHKNPDVIAGGVHFIVAYGDEAPEVEIRARIGALTDEGWREVEALFQQLLGRRGPQLTLLPSGGASPRRSS